MANLSVFEIKAVVDDARAEAVGRLTVGFTIWETAVIPSLLHSAEVWTEMGNKSLKMLEKIQLKYLRLVTGVGTGCPKPILYYHTGTMSMKNRIWLRKILFLHHVATLPLGCLARDTYETMRKHNHRGLVSECEPILRELEIHDIQSYSKHNFKKIVKAKFLLRNKLELLKDAEKYKKYPLNCFLKVNLLCESIFQNTVCFSVPPSFLPSCSHDPPCSYVLQV